MEFDHELGVWKGNKVPFQSLELPSPLWIFGYGSLCWKPSFPFLKRKIAYIEGYIRRPWQASTDHRGTPKSPGLVMTLISNDEYNNLKQQHFNKLEDEFLTDKRVYGVAYEIADEDIETVVEEMDFREKGGYIRMLHDINMIDNNKNEITKIKGLLYTGTITNPNFRFSTLEECSSIISIAQGPSGHNVDYLLKLHHFFFVENGINDEYIETLVSKIKKNFTKC